MKSYIQAILRTLKFVGQYFFYYPQFKEIQLAFFVGNQGDANFRPTKTHNSCDTLFKKKS